MRRRGGQVEALGLATSLPITAFLNSFGSDQVLGASAPQMLLGVGRPGLSRGLIEDVRDALEGSLWYMRPGGGRYYRPAGLPCLHLETAGEVVGA